MKLPAMWAAVAALVALPAPLLAAEDVEVNGRKKSEWIKVLKDDPKRNRRVGAVYALGIVGPTHKDAVDALLAALLEDKEVTVRQKVLEVLGGFKFEDLRPTLPKRALSLRSESDATVRAEAAVLIGKLGDLAKPAQNQLALSLKDADALVRAACCETLGKIGLEAREAAPAVATLLKDADERVRSAAVYALPRLGADPKSGARALAEMLPGEKDELARKTILRAIGSFGPEAGGEVPAVLGVLRADPSDEVRQQAVLTLGKLGPASRPELPALLDVMKKDRDKTVRLYLTRTLTEIFGDQSRASLGTPYAEQLNREAEGENRAAIAQELGVMMASEALPQLNVALKDVQVPVRDAAKAAIKRITGKK